MSQILGQQSMNVAVNAAVQRRIMSHATVEANLQHQRQQRNLLLAAVVAAAPAAVPSKLQTSVPSLAEQWGQLTEAERQEIRRSLEALSLSIGAFIGSLAYMGKSPLTLIALGWVYHYLQSFCDTLDKTLSK
jgi:hypothetical protein